MSAPPPLQPDQLDAAIETELVGRPMPQGGRVLGIEFERLLLDRQTRENAPLAFCRGLLQDLVADLGAEPREEDGVLTKLVAPDFGISMEPAGQLEINLRAQPDVISLEREFYAVTEVIERRLSETPYRLFALGHAPCTPVAELGLLPRTRYKIMDRALPERGKLARNMMRATAGLQVTCDFADRDGAGLLLALFNRWAPVLNAMTANSREVEGKDSGYASYRQWVWWNTDPSRCGIPEGALDREHAVAAYVRFARRAVALFTLQDGALVAAPAKPFEELVQAGKASVDDVALHLTTLFPFVRLRNYLELRCFDSVAWPLGRAVVSLVGGLAHCPDASEAAYALAAPLAVRDPAALQTLHEEAARVGLDAKTPDGQSFKALTAALLDLAAGALDQPGCDWAARIDLEPLRALV